MTKRKLHATRSLFRLCTLVLLTGALTTLFTHTGNAQTTIVSCDTTFFDSGGPTSRYSNNENITTTFCSDNNSRVQVIFTEFDVRGADFLRVYDGPNTTFTLIDSFSGTSGFMPSILISSDTCLTFNFTSNAFQNEDGWAAEVSCAQPVLPFLGPEICNDMIDNDGDGFTDQQDLDCPTPVTQASFACENASTYYFPPIWMMSSNGGGSTLYNEPASLSFSTLFPMANVTIETVDGSFSTSVTVNNSGPTTLSLTGSGAGQTNNFNTVETDKGLIVTSDFPIQAIYRVDGTNNKVLLAGKGSEGIGKSFIAASQINTAIQDQVNIDRMENHFVSIMGTEANTTVTLRFDSPIDGITSPHTFTLGRGETYLVKDDDRNVSVTGMRITSDKDIAVASGSMHTRIFEANDLDGGIDILVPLQKVGTDYVVQRGGVDEESEYTIIVAIENNTEVFIDGSAVPVVSLDAGEFYRFNAPTGYVKGQPTFIQTSMEAYLFHVTGETSQETGMGLVGATDPCRGSRLISFPRFNGGVNTLQVVLPTAALSSLTLNGNQVTSLTNVNTFSVPGISTPYTAVSIGDANLGTNNVLLADDNFTAGLLVGSPQAGTFGYLTSFEERVFALDPANNIPANIFNGYHVCHNDSTEICIDFDGCGVDYQLIDIQSGTFTESIRFTSDSCLVYNPLDTYNGKDTISVVFENDLGIQGSVCLIVEVSNHTVTLQDDITVCDSYTSTLTTTVENGFLPYTYLWDDGSTDSILMVDITETTTFSVTVTDDFGCEDVDSTTITIIDSVPAEAGIGGTICPSGMIQLGATLPPGSTGLWSGGAGTFDNATSPTATYTSDGSEAGTTVTLTWTVDPNNVCPPESDDVDIIILSDTPPGLSISPVTLECDEDYTDIALIGNVTVTSSSSPPSDTTEVFIENLIGCGGYTGTVTRRITVTDSCGSLDSIDQIITIEDTTQPTVPTPPNDTIISCEDLLPTAIELTATDNCSSDITVSPILLRNSGSGCINDTLILTRRWVFTDPCGNSDSIEQLIKVVDDITPTVPSPPNDTIVACLADIPVAMTLTATDNCDASDITVSPTDTDNGGSGCPTDTLIVTRNWVFADACGNMDSVQQLIKVVSDNPPTVPTPPADVTINCVTLTPAVVDLTATSECGDPLTVTGVDTDNGASGCVMDTLIITRNWVFADACGNADSVQQLIKVVDDVDPVVPSSVPADVQIACITDLPMTIDLTATDNCSPDIVVTGVDSDNGGSGCMGDTLIITRKWIFTDDCMNSDSVEQIIKVIDDVVPTVPSPPADVQIACITDLPMTVDLTATDNCSADIVVTGVDTDNGGTGCMGDTLIVTRKWVFTDDCMNSDSVEQTIKVIDDVAPTVPAAPADIQIACITDIPATIDLTATDNCGPNIVVTGVDTDNGGTGCMGDTLIVTRKWVFTDGCMNSDSVEQLIKVVDDVIPTVPAAPADLQIACITDLPATIDLTATDNCSADIVVTGVDTDNGGTGCMGDTLIVTRKWVFTDACMNSDSVEQLIKVVDDVAPTVPAAPADLQIACITDLPATIDLTATDNCGPNIVVTGVDSDNGASGCAGDTLVVLRKWVFTDACMNSDSVEQTIKVIDDVAPAVPAAPADLQIACITDLPATIDLTATDNCGPDIVVTGVDSDNGGTGCAGDTLIVTRKWIFTDACMNMDSVQQVIKVVDDVAPMVPAAPADLQIACISDLPPAVDLTATDNCSPDITITGVDSDNGGSGCAGDTLIVIRKWVFTDACMNSDSTEQIIKIVDEEAPMTPAAPADITIACIADVPMTIDLTATDNCSPDITVSGSDTDNGGSGCAGDTLIITRTWLFTDNCTNSDSVVQLIKVVDDVAPTPPAAPAEIEVSCLSDVPVSGTLTATDNCAGVITATGVDTNNGGTGCIGDTLVVTRTWVFTDPCGNSDSVQQIINVVDKVAPELPTMVPGNANYSCIEDVPAASTLTANDLCAGPITTLPTEVNNGGAGSVSDPIIITRTWIFADNCMNTDSVVQMITIVNSDTPMAPMPPADITVACPTDVPPPIDLTASAGCGNTLVVTGVDTDNGGVGCPTDSLIITRTWEFDDGLGNDTIVTQTITVVDDEAPIIIIPVPDDTVTCADLVPNPPDLMPMDNCSGVDTNLVIFDNRGLGCEFNPLIITYQWTFTDSCGNMAMAEARIWVINDTELDDAVIPVDVTVSCLQDVPMPELITITNTCGQVVRGMIDEETNGGTGCAGDTLIVTRTYEFIDRCQFTSQGIQRIFVIDDEVPTPESEPADVVVSCVEDVPDPIDLTATDNCSDDITVTPIDTDNGSTGCVTDTLIITRSWTFADDCGNDTTVFQIINVVDETIPMVPSPPNDTIISCLADLPVAPELSADDLCSDAVIGVVNDTDNGGAGCTADPLIITRRWVFTDDCGNSDSIQHQITVIDDTPPTMDAAPMDTMVDCITRVPVAIRLGIGDNCSGLDSVDAVDSDNGGVGCATDPLIITRTWNYSDACGNSISESQTITVIDDESPEMVIPPNDTIVNCIAEVPAGMDLTAMDNCSADITVSPVDTDNGGAGTPADPLIITRTWTFSDDCMNMTAASQVITVADTIQPQTGEAPNDTMVMCVDEVPMGEPIAASDNCSTLGSVDPVDTDNGGAGCPSDPLIITRTWTFSDDSGNDTVLMQVITVSDTLNPALPIGPMDEMFMCPADVTPAVSLTAVDNCDGDIPAVFTEVNNGGSGLIGDTLIITRKWLFTDVCGNSDSLEQMVVVVESAEPMLPIPPAEVIVSCTEEVPAPVDLTASEQCGTMITVSPTESNNGGTGCINDTLVITRTWVFTFSGGNSDSVSQLIKVVDDFTPSMETAPMDFTIACLSELPAPESVILLDNCNGDPAVSISDISNDGQGCLNDPLLITRRFSITDNCGNTAEIDQIITIIDTISPVAATAPNDTMVQCVVNIPEAPVLTATDNCGMDIVGVSMDTDNGGAGTVISPLVITRTWTFTDDCGNTSTSEQIITVEDDGMPDIPTVPNDTTLTCLDLLPDAPVLTAVEGCGDMVDAVFEEISNDEGPCSAAPQIITRTWTFNLSSGAVEILTQTITIFDDVPPIISAAPEGAMYECVADIPEVSVMDTPTATDNCTGVEVVLVERTEGVGCTADPYILTRTWIATDGCGNQDSVSQIISVVDTTAPVAPMAPADITVNCFEPIPDAVELTAIDNCNGDIVGVVTDVENMRMDFISGVLVRTWTFTDACGNSSSVSQNIVCDQLPDLSISKTVATATNNYGEIASFDITIINEGNVDVTNILVTDYMPCGFVFDAAANPGWSINPSGNLNYTFTETLVAQEQTTLTLNLIVQECLGDVNAWTNSVEISSFTDGAGNVLGDTDSTPDDIFGNDADSEDDFNTATAPVGDLAISKSDVLPGTEYENGQTITYDIVVSNQGNTDIYDVLLTEYIPCGLDFVQADNPEWVFDAGSNTAQFTFTDTIRGNEQVSLPFMLTVSGCGDDDAYINTVEVSGGTTAGLPYVDHDSTPDADKDNDPVGEDDIATEEIVVLNGTVGGSVWLDLNVNGIRDFGEPGLEGVEVRLQTCNGLTVDVSVSDANGNYEFEAIDPADYRVRFTKSTLPVGNLFTIQDAGSDDSIDSDPNANGTTVCQYVAAGAFIDDVDAGVIAPSDVGDFVWFDTNANGIQDQFEPGIDGIRIYAFNEFGVLEDSTTTDQNGMYSFASLPSGKYTFVFLPSNEDLEFTLPNVGNNDAVDSDVIGTNDDGFFTDTFDITAGFGQLNIDAGFYECVEVGDYVFYDSNLNDIADPNENGINGLDVNLYRRVNGTFVLFDTEKTGHKPNTPSDDGYFKFCVPPGEYYIEVIIPPLGLVLVQPNVGNNEEVDSDITNRFGPGTSDAFFVTSGQDVCDLGAGYYPMATIGNLVWMDVNLDGIQQTSEPKAANVRVMLYDDEGNYLRDTYTNPVGRYSFDYLRKEGYFLKFDMPNGYAATMGNMTSEEMDSDIDHTNGFNTTTTYYTSPGQNYVNVDAGLIFGVLPLDWGDISATAREDDNLVEWSTLNELNTAYFEVYRILPGERTAENIGRVEAAGTTTEESYYSLEDEDVAKTGLYNYFIKQYDLDGKYTESDYVTAFREESEKDINMFPNPAQGMVYFQMNGYDSDEVEIKMFDQLGKMIRDEVISGDKIKSGRIELAIDDMPYGIYNIVIKINGELTTKRLIIVE